MLTLTRNLQAERRFVTPIWPYLLKMILRDKRVWHRPYVCVHILHIARNDPISEGVNKGFSLSFAFCNTSKRWKGGPCVCNGSFQQFLKTFRFEKLKFAYHHFHCDQCGLFWGRPGQFNLVVGPKKVYRTKDFCPSKVAGEVSKWG